MRCYHCMKEINSDGKEAKFCPFCGSKPTAKNPPHHLPAGTVLHDKYIVGSSIGEGGFGITYIGVDKTLDLRIAIKEYFPSGYANRNSAVSLDVSRNMNNPEDFFGHGRENFLREAKSIALFSSEDGIVDVRDYFNENNTAYIVMEYLDGETLGKHVNGSGTFAAEEIFTLLLPIMSSLKKMHRQGIIHRDISPDNIMYLKSGSLKLMDFGSARYFSSAEQKTMSITLKPGYAPYEQYSANGNQGPWTDVYGLCATIYKCITGEVPPDSLDRFQDDTLKKPSELGADITPELEDVLMYGLALRQSERCQSMSELMDITHKALSGQPFRVYAAGAAAPVDDYKTVSVIDDDIPRAKKPAQPSARNGSAAVNNRQGMRQAPPAPPYMQPRQYAQPQPKPQSGSKTALITVIAIVSALAIAGIIFAVIWFMNGSGDDGGSSSSLTETSTQATTAAPTTAATTEPTTVEPTTVEPTTEEPTTEEPTQKPTQKPTAPPVINDLTPDDASYFSSAIASSQLEDQTDSETKLTYNYDPNNVLSNDSACWCEGGSGTGIGEWIQLDLPGKRRLRGLEIVNGYAGTEKQYVNNTMPTRIRIDFSNGESVEKTLYSLSYANCRQSQTISFSSDFDNGYVDTEYVIITILDTTSSIYDDTCITYIEPY